MCCLRWIPSPRYCFGELLFRKGVAGSTLLDLPFPPPISGGGNSRSRRSSSSNTGSNSGGSLLPPACLPGYRQLCQDCWSDDPGQRPTAEKVLERMRGVAAEATVGLGSKLPQAPAGLVRLPQAAAGSGLMHSPHYSRLPTATHAQGPQNAAFKGDSSEGALPAGAVTDISFDPPYLPDLSDLPDLPDVPDPSDLPDVPDLQGLPEPLWLLKLPASSAGGSSSGSPSRCSSLQPPLSSWGSSSGGSGDDQEAAWTWSLDLPAVPETPSAAAAGGRGGGHPAAEEGSPCRSRATSLDVFWRRPPSAAAPLLRAPTRFSCDRPNPRYAAAKACNGGRLPSAAAPPQSAAGSYLPSLCASSRSSFSYCSYEELMGLPLEERVQLISREGIPRYTPTPPHLHAATPLAQGR